jgi:hypothetical protein
LDDRLAKDAAQNWLIRALLRKELGADKRRIGPKTGPKYNPSAAGR